MYHGTTLVDTFIMDCREEFNEVIAFAHAIKRRAREERTPLSMDMLPEIERTIIDDVPELVPGPTRYRATCTSEF